MADGKCVEVGANLAAMLESDPSFKCTLLDMLDKCAKEGKKHALIASLQDVVDIEAVAPEVEKEEEVFHREYEYIWTIENYSRIRYLPKGLGFLAPFFRTMPGVEGQEDAQWSWGVVPCNSNFGKKHHLGLFIRLRNFDVFTANNNKVVANVAFRMYDKDLKVVSEEKGRNGTDIDNWVTRDGLNANDFVHHDVLDQMLSAEGANDTVRFGIVLRVKIDHEVSELQKNKKTIEYTTQASVDKFCFQHRIEKYLEHQQTEEYLPAATFLQQLPSGKIAEWEATYRRGKDGKLGAKLRLANGDHFKSCEIVSGSHFIVLCAGTPPEGEGEEGDEEVVTVDSGWRIATQQGQRMRDDWNLSTAESGWGRSNLIEDSQVEAKKSEILDGRGALVLNYTLYLNTSTHDRREGNTDLGKASLDGGRSGAQGKKKKIMLSYNWGTKETVHKIKDALESWGFDTWIDDNQMGDNVMLSMAEGVFNSDAVLICLTDNYQNSFNCQREASMTYDERKPMIPLKLEGGVDWKPWVKLLISGKRYIEMDRSPSFDAFATELKTYLDRMEELK